VCVARSRRYSFYGMRPFSLIAVATAASLFASGCTQKEAAPRQNNPTTNIGQSPAGVPVTAAPNADPGQAMAGAQGIPEPARMPSVLANDSSGDPLALISTIDTSITLGAWSKAHPVDSVVSISITGHNEALCRTSIAKVKVGAQTMIRSAVFDMSAPPISEKLPADSIEAFNQFCTLRTIWMSAYFPDSADARVFADSVRGVIAARLGTAKPQASLFTYEADKAVGNTWQNQATTIVLAVQPAMKESSDTSLAAHSAKAARGSRVLLVGYAPGSTLQAFDAHWEREKQQLDHDAKFAYGVADSAIGWANAPAIATDLRFIIGQLRDAQIRDDNKQDPRVIPALLRAVKATHDIAPSLPAPRRAALLFATDIVLFATLPFVPTDTTQPTARALTAAGITFDNLPIDDVLQNTRPWLWEAYHVDSLGRGGHAAFVELLSLGWSTRGACNEGGSDFEKIIEHGEAAIRRGDTDPMVHYYVGSAYKTIWDSAHMEEGNELVDPRPYRPRADAARSKAIEHYRAALAGLRDGPERRLAWIDAVKLILGRSEQPEHICFYD
jgi:hypothetical protein